MGFEIHVRAYHGEESSRVVTINNDCKNIEEVLLYVKTLMDEYQIIKIVNLNKPVSVKCECGNSYTQGLEEQHNNTHCHKVHMRNRDW